MGKGYWILLADGFGAGLVLINSRLYTEGVDMYGNPCNWWPRDDDETEEDILKKHKLKGYVMSKVIFDE